MQTDERARDAAYSFTDATNLAESMQHSRTTDADAATLIRGIHKAPQRLVIVLTGGGSEAISELLTVPGASRTVLEATVPYAAAALADYLGAPPEHACDERTARAMAMAAYQRAQRLAAPSNPKFAPELGIACTASLASDRPKRGDHRIHVALQSEVQTTIASVTLSKGLRDRPAEERIASNMILNLIAAGCSVVDRLTLDLSETAGESVRGETYVAPDSWQGLLAGRVERVDAQGRLQNAGPPRLLFPGAFNPLHEGHLRMAQLAIERLGGPLAFELSVTNVDKPPLDFIEIRNRLSHFDTSQQVWLTRAPTFAEKAGQFPKSVFVVGADTIVRVGDPRYYGGDLAARDGAIAAIGQRGCRFLVFGRLHEGRFETLDDLGIPKELRALCEGVGANDFRSDISSTVLRRAAGE